MLCSAYFWYYMNLKNWIKTVKLLNSNGFCTCDDVKSIIPFYRGNYLTGHLSTVHDYKWPQGHKKFLYTKDESGLYHVQTMRFERIDLMSANFDEEN